MRSFTNSGGSAATQVKVVQPRDWHLAMGQGVLCPSSQYRGRRYQASLSRHAEKARTGPGDTAIGPTHSSGVAGAMPGGGPSGAASLEGVGSQLFRAEEVRAMH